MSMKKISTFIVSVILAALPTCAFAQAWAETLTVAGHWVGGEQAIVSVTGSGIEGSVTYDYNKKELVLEDATITLEADKNAFGIASGVDLTIVVKGYCEVNVSGGADANTSNCGIYSEGNLSIQLEPESCLSIESNGLGIYTDTDKELNVTGGQYSFLSVNAKVFGLALLGTFSADCLVISAGAVAYYGPNPVNENYGVQTGKAEYSEESQTFLGEDGKAASLVYLGGIYGVYVSGEPLTDYALLFIHLLGDDQITYDKDTKTLTIDVENVSYEGDEKDELRNTPMFENKTVDGLTIQFNAADVTLEHECSLFRIQANTTLEGNYNYLNLKANGEAECFYVLNGASLTLKNMNIFGEGGWGIVGPNMKECKEKLFIDNSYIQLDTKYAAVSDFKVIDLGNCRIEEPYDGRVDIGGFYNNLAIVDGTGDWAKYVVISIIDEGVENLNRSDAKVNRIYDVSGAEKQKLSRGLNILRMDDGTVRKILKR